MILPSQTFSVMFPQFFKRIHSQSFLFLCHHVSRKSGLNRNLSNLEFSNVGAYIGFNSSGALSSSETPTGCPNKNSKYKRKIEFARGGGGGGEDDGKRGKGLSFLFSLPIVPRAASLFFHSRFPTTQRGRSAEGRPSMVHARFNMNLQVFPLPIRPVLN